MVGKKNINSHKEINTEKIAKKLRDAALELAKNEGWSAVDILLIAKTSGVSLGDAIYIYPTPTHLLYGLFDSIDKDILDTLNLNPPEGETARERLFDLIMRYFDSLQSIRDSFLAILNGIRTEPLTASIYGTKLLRTSAWVLLAAGVSTTGIMRKIEIKALGVIFILTLNTWRKDKSEDLAKTMATLDRSLCEAEKLAAFFRQYSSLK